MQGSSSCLQYTVFACDAVHGRRTTPRTTTYTYLPIRIVCCYCLLGVFSCTEDRTYNNNNNKSSRLTGPDQVKSVYCVCVCYIMSTYIMSFYYYYYFFLSRLPHAFTPVAAAVRRTIFAHNSIFCSEEK